jgi:hypothetical protein
LAAHAGGAGLEFTRRVQSGEGSLGGQGSRAGQREAEVAKKSRPYQNNSCKVSYKSSDNCSINIGIVMSFTQSYVVIPMLATLGQALGTAAGIIQTIGLVAVFGGLIGAAVAALSERHLSGVKTSLVIAAIGGLAWLIAMAFFAAGGANITIQPGAVN